MAENNPEFAMRIQKRAKQNVYKKICRALDQADTNPLADSIIKNIAEEMQGHKVFTDDGGRLADEFSFGYHIPICLGGSVTQDNLWVVTKNVNNILRSITSKQLHDDLVSIRRPFLIVVPNEENNLGRSRVFFCSYSPPVLTKPAACQLTP